MGSTESVSELQKVWLVASAEHGKGAWHGHTHFALLYDGCCFMLYPPVARFATRFAARLLQVPEATTRSTP